MMNPDGTVALLPFLLTLLVVCGALYLVVYAGVGWLVVRWWERQDARERREQRERFYRDP
jgi:hypothetical protein